MLRSTHFYNFYENRRKNRRFCLEIVKKSIFKPKSPVFSPVFMIFKFFEKMLHSTSATIVVCPENHFSSIYIKFTAMISHDLKTADHGTSLSNTADCRCKIPDDFYPPFVVRVVFLLVLGEINLRRLSCKKGSTIDSTSSHHSSKASSSYFTISIATVRYLSRTDWNSSFWQRSGASS